MKFGIIGTGFICDTFMEAAVLVEGFELAAVYSRSKSRGEAFAARYGGCKVHTDLQAFASDPEIAAVYVASPNSSHCEQSILMMEHGRHVLCEKPVASNSQELTRMLHEAKKQGLVFLEAMRPVFDPGFERIVSLLPKLGTIRRVTFQYCQHSSRYERFKKGENPNAFNPALSNAAVMDIGVYCIYPLVKLFGLPKDLQVKSLFLDNGMEGAGTILAGYDGMQAELLYSKVTDSRLPSQIQGEDGSMVIREIADTTEVVWYPRGGEPEHFVIDKPENNMGYELGTFISLIENGGDTGEYDRCSTMVMQVMDEVRRIAGIRFHDEDPLFS